MSLRVAISRFPIHPISTVFLPDPVVIVVHTRSIDTETSPGQLGRSHGVSEMTGAVFPLHVEPLPYAPILSASKNPRVHSGSYPSMTGLELGI